MCPKESNEASFLMKAASAASVLVAVFLIILKVAALAATDSLAMLSSLIDSSLDAAASFLNFWAIRESLVPADSAHRFGHGKVEPLASLGQAAFIAGSAVLLIFQGIQCILRPREIGNAGLGMAAMGISMVVTLGVDFVSKIRCQKNEIFGDFGGLRALCGRHYVECQRHAVIVHRLLFQI